MENTTLTIDIFKWDCIRVTPSTLFKKKKYAGLTEEEKWQQAIQDGWRFDMNLNKFYKMIN